MLAIEEFTTETIIHQKTVEHRITSIDHGFVKPPHYYWINCINCFQNIADVKRKNSNFYLTNCGCLYCMDCLHEGLGKCFVHDKVTNAKSLSLNTNSAEIILENHVVGQKFNNLFRNNMTMILDLEKAIEFTNKSFDVSVERLDQLLHEGECEKERLLAKLTGLEKENQKIDLDITNLQRVRRVCENDRYSATGITNSREDKFDSSFSYLKLPNNYGVSNNFNRRIENVPNSFNSNECRGRPNTNQLLCQKVRESEDTKVIKHYWDTITGKEKSDNTRNNHTLKKSGQMVGFVPSTDNFRDFQNIRNPANKLGYSQSKLDHKLDGRDNGRNKLMMKPVSKSEDYQDLLSKSSRYLTTKANNLQNRSTTKNTNIPNKNSENGIINRKVSFRNQTPTKKNTFCESIQPSSPDANNFLTKTANILQNRHQYGNISNKHYETDINKRGGILKNKMPSKDFTFSPNLKPSNSKGKSCNTQNEVKLNSGTKLKERISERKVKLDSLNENERKTVGTASCIGSVTDLISRIRSEIDKIKSPDITTIKELRQNKYEAETLEGSIKNPGNFETVWISENIDDVEELSNTFDSDIFNLRTYE